MLDLDASCFQPWNRWNHRTLKFYSGNTLLKMSETIGVFVENSDIKPGKKHRCCQRKPIGLAIVIFKVLVVW